MEMDEGREGGDAGAGLETEGGRRRVWDTMSTDRWGERNGKWGEGNSHTESVGYIVSGDFQTLHLAPGRCLKSSLMEDRGPHNNDSHKYCVYSADLTKDVMLDVPLCYICSPHRENNNGLLFFVSLLVNYYLIKTERPREVSATLTVDKMQSSLQLLLFWKCNTKVFQVWEGCISISSL